MLALTAALVGPYFVDWTSYRADFEREASRILGRQVTVNGTASARILPFPSVTFTDVSVAGRGATEPAMTVETFSMDAELAPFMRGEILIFDMRLTRPRALLRSDAGGRIDWAIRPEPPAGLSQVTLESVTVIDGEIAIEHGASGRTRLISAINADISARTLAGPWRMSGTMAVEGEMMEATVSTGSIDADGMRLRLRIEPENYPVTIQTDGEARFRDAAPHYAGTFSLSPRKEEEDADAPFQVTVSEDDGAAAIARMRVFGTFDLDHRQLVFDRFRFENGPADDPYAAEGSAWIDLGDEPRFAVRAEGRQVSFDRDIGAAEAGNALGLAERLTALRDVLAGAPKPTIPGTLDLALPAVVAGQTTIRDVALQAEPAAGGWDIKQFSAQLPGRSTLEASGLLTVGTDLAFAGDLLLAVGQPSGFAAWLTDDVQDAIRRLPSAGISASVDLSAERQNFRELELILGRAKFTGALDRLQPKGAKPTAALQLSGGALDVDGLAAFAALFVSGAGDYRFTDHDLDLAVTAGPVAIAGIAAESIDTAIRLKDGRLDVDRLAIGGLAGASISATATLEQFPDDPRGNVDASILAADLEPLVRVVADRFPADPNVAILLRRVETYPGLLADVEANLIASIVAEGAGETAVAASAQGRAGGSVFSATFSGRGAPERPAAAPVTVNVTARNDDAAPILAAYGLPALPLGLGGRAETGFSAKGSLDDGFDITISLSGPEALARLSATTEGRGEAMRIAGTANLSGSDIEPWLMATGNAPPGLGTGLPVDLEASFVWTGATIDVLRLTGTVLDSPVAGKFSADVAGDKPFLSGSLEAGTLDLQFLAAMLVGAAALEGEGVWPQTAIAAQPFFPLEGELEVIAQEVLAGAGYQARDVTARLTMGGNRIRLADFSGTTRGGRLTGLAELANNAGSALLSGQMTLRDADLEQLLPGAGLSGRGDVSVTLNASGKSIGSLASGLSGSGTATLRGVTADGLNAAAFDALIAAADRIGRDIDAERTAAFAPPILRDGRLQAGSVEFAFNIAGGVARSAPVRIEAGPATVTVELRADIASATVAADGTIAFDPGREKLVGSEPSAIFAYDGALGAAELAIDTGALAQFLTQRALEREQARVEAMQAVLLERQRLRRETRYFAALEAERERLRREVEARLRAVEEARRLAEEARRRAEQEQEPEGEAPEQGPDEVPEEPPEDEQPLNTGATQSPAPPPNRGETDARDTAIPEEASVERRPLPEVEGLPGVNRDLFGVFTPDRLQFD